MERILKILEENARISMEDIAAMIGATPAAVAQYMDEAQASGKINGYHAIIDWEKTEVPNVQAVIELRVTPRRDCGFDEIAQVIARFAEVDSVYLMSGGYDLSLMLRGKTFQDIAQFVARRLSPLDGVVSTATHFVLKTYKKDGVVYGEDARDERVSQ